jgi:tetratricopeptide (TPR) repeat protein
LDTPHSDHIPRNGSGWATGLLLSLVVLLATTPGVTLASETAIDSLNAEAYRLFHERDFGKADKAARLAHSLCCPDSDLRSAGIASANLAALLTLNARFDQAQSLQREADALFARAGLKERRGRLQVARAVTSFLLARRYSADEPNEALSDLHRATALLDTNDLGLCIVTAEIMARSNRPERFQSGYADLVRLVALCRQKGISGSASVCARHLAVMEGVSGGHRAALKYNRMAYEAEQAQGHELEAADALRNIGLAQRKLEEYTASEESLHQALGLATKLHDKRMQFVVLNDLALLLTEAGRGQAAQLMDVRADSMLRSIAADLQSGTLEDNILFDFHGLVRQRYANLLPYGTDLFEGFCEQLALNPAE